MTDRPLRIVHCFRAPVGGIFRHVRDLVEAQHKAGHAVGIVCDSTTGGAFEQAALADMEGQLALGLTRFPMRRQVALSDITAAMRLFRKVRPLRPDVIHCHGAKGGAFGRMTGTLLRASGSRVARIYTPHGGSLNFDPKSAAGRVYFSAERIFERMTDAFIFVSQFEADTYALKVGKPRRASAVIRNGLKPAEFEPVPALPEARDFLFIGELRPVKGVDILIQALARVKERRGAAPTAILVGAGPERARCEAMAAELGLGDSVLFHAPMPARAALAQARAVVIPSRAESMPYVVLETVASGKPLLTTNVGGIPEVFGPESGRLLPPGDVGALADALENVLDAPEVATSIALGLRDQIRQSFSTDAMAAGILAVYASVTKPRE